MSLGAAGFAVFAPDADVARWAEAARVAALGLVAKGPRRHGETWFVGVDALPNGPDGAISGVPLKGPWERFVRLPLSWHRAQVSVVFQGYPARDAGETEAAHGYRLRRDAAHVDGLLPVGPERRRYLREAHDFVLGLALNRAAPGAAPLVVWEGSHRVMGEIFENVFKGLPPETWAHVDVTETYQAARREVFASCPRRELPLLPGQSVLLHRHLLHGISPWKTGAWAEEPGRMAAYFRPVLADVARWCGGGH